jgi:protocatechuate 3,4-dioxygenase beta subunit
MSLGEAPSWCKVSRAECESQAVLQNMELAMKRIIIGGVIVLALAAGISAFNIVNGPSDVRVLNAVEKANCGLSVAVTEGPYYVSGTGALQGGNLNATNLPGTPLRVSGHIYEGLDNSKPVANAKIEIWHADTSGNYHPNANGDIAKYKPEEIALRGFITTDASGAYSFTTVYPGEYSGRTRHIHFKITAGVKSLTTQLIIPSLAGDKITFDDDTIAQGLPRCALLKVDTSVTLETANFDFRL